MLVFFGKMEQNLVKLSTLDRLNHIYHNNLRNLRGVQQTHDSVYLTLGTSSVYGCC